MKRVLVAMSGGVDSSVAAALALAQGYEVVGATMKLWGGPSDSGCCSVADVEDARRVCQQLGVAHHVFNFTAEFEREVVARYVSAHEQAATPNPCISCNAHLKFDRFFERARQLGFDMIATGHHARVTCTDGVFRLRRGHDPAKDQSYVLYMLGQQQLSSLELPVGEMTKAQVRAVAADLRLRTAAKADSQDVCFISRQGGRQAFLGERIPVRPGRLVGKDGSDFGEVPELELLTVGQRRGLGTAVTGPERRYVVGVDLATRTATLGSLEDLLVAEIPVADVSWSAAPVPAGTAVMVQASAHGRPLAARWQPSRPHAGRVVLEERARRIAPGQAVVLYEGDIVLGGGTVPLPA
ncbi:MAG TPA: tRNA 2-thiouridine(34) synthase MnmA [Acidimicrobiales bacterium]|nr:tRNA 2-thiouridine(34) synthase MnmA [Acidimicrobiales bacterium]